MCGKCCVNTILSRFEYEFIKNKFPNLIDILKKFEFYGICYIKWGECPFLTEKKVCLIYELRPFICRAYPIILRNEELFYIEKNCPKHDTITDEDIIDALHNLDMLIIVKKRENEEDFKKFGEENVALNHLRFANDSNYYETDEKEYESLESFLGTKKFVKILKRFKESCKNFEKNYRTK